MDQTNVGNMGGYYGRQYSTEDMQRLGEMDPNAIMGYISSNGIDTAMMDGQTLDEIINQNSKEMQRRQSFHQSQAFHPTNIPLDRHPRRSSSMLDFGGLANNGELDGFQFDPSTVQHNLQMQRPPNMAQRRFQNQTIRRREAPDNLALNTQFHNIGPGYSPMTSASPFPQSAFHHSDPISGLDITPNYIHNNTMMGMEFSAGGLGPENSDMSTMNAMFTQNHMSPHMSTPPLQQDIPHAMRASIHDPGGGSMDRTGDSALTDNAQMQMADRMPILPAEVPQRNENMQPAESIQQLQNVSNFSEPPGPQPPTQQTSAMNLDVSNTGDEPVPSNQSVATQSAVPQYKNAYSSSGFDMLGVLMRVAARPNPQINIGAVDMSCAFAVCDVTQHDIPIVYCSDIFERLTGYTKHEILGRNCRFLQAPDGKIQAGVKRKYVDDQSVLRIKNMITARQEMQTSIINYRKGGQPFMNLLTMIPITWDTDEIKYYVGFQVDLVEQPTSITNKNPGTFAAALVLGPVPNKLLTAI